MWMPTRDVSHGVPAQQVFVQDPWVQYVIDEIYGSYGDVVSPKPKQLRKFGRTTNADADVKTTVATLLQPNETHSTTNDIDGIVSSSGSDAGSVTIEGHYLDGSNNLIFAVQTVTLTGQTKATLTTPLARATRAYRTRGTFASPATDLVGNIYVYASDGVTLSAGVPQTTSSVKLMIVAGAQQSEKCATSISSTDYWAVTKFAAAVQKGNSSTVNVDIDIEYREQGGVWRPLGLEISLRSGAVSTVTEELKPYGIIPKNSDVRMIAISNTNDATVSGRIAGQLMAVA